MCEAVFRVKAGAVGAASHSGSTKIMQHCEAPAMAPPHLTNINIFNFIFKIRMKNVQRFKCNQNEFLIMKRNEAERA
jgi:hypothetical protein